MYDEDETTEELEDQLQDLYADLEDPISERHERLTRKAIAVIEKKLAQAGCL